MSVLPKKQLLVGLHACLEGLDADVLVERIYIKKGLRNDASERVVAKAREMGVPVNFVPREKLDRLSNMNHQGILGIRSAIRYHEMEELVIQAFERGETPFVLLLDQITDVRNLGAIARTAECMGVHALVIPAYGSASPNEVAIRTSAGALTRLPISRVEDVSKAVLALRDMGLRVLGASEKAELELPQAQVSGPVAVVMGNEEVGLSDKVAKSCDELVRIPMRGSIGSLNVSVAAGMMLYAIAATAE